MEPSAAGLICSPALTALLVWPAVSVTGAVIPVVALAWLLIVAVPVKAAFCVVKISPVGAMNSTS